MKLLILGGAGTIASLVIYQLIADDYFDEIVVSDYNEASAEKVVRGLNNPKLKASKADVFDKARLLELMNEADVVANCTGPYYLLLEPVMDAFLDSDCLNYIDFCDDIEAIEAVMTPENQKRSKDKGQHIIIGLGGSPGVIPVEIMYGASLMDEVETVQLSMLMDELEEGGPAVWDHMFENFYGDVTTYEDGKLKTVKGFSDLVEYDFPKEVFGDIGKVKLYDLGHPEVFTIPQALPNVKNIKIKCAFYPPEGMDYVIEMDRQGFLDTKPVKVGEVEVSPRLVFLKLMENTVMNPEYPGGFQPEGRAVEDYGTGTVIDVYGTKDGKKAHFQSAFQTNMGTVTGYPLAVGARLLAEGKIEGLGMMIPEVAITDQGSFVNEVFDSIRDLGHPMKKTAHIKYGL